MPPILHLVQAKNVFVFEQLLREEALFRNTQDNWCLLVQGSAPAIVMSHLSTDKASLLDQTRWQQRPLPLVRRYSGGGTVVVDEDTFFVCWILNSQEIAIDPYPQVILQWVHQQFHLAMQPLAIELQESDYCLKVDGSWCKVIGNAQAISKKRFVHHSSFLWDYNQENMQLLTNPRRQPTYRERREHESFLFPLSKTGLSQDRFQNQLIEQLKSHFQVITHSYTSLDPYLAGDYRRSCSIEHPSQ